jgi:hypothetical protein
LQKNILNSKEYISTTATWILLRQNKYFDKWWYSYIWVKEFDETYCWTWEITKTNHLYVSNFIPLKNVQTEDWGYKSNINNHQIIKTSDNTVVVWKDIYWDKFNEWDFWTWVLLNSPTGLVEVDWKVVFSDTLNDRILYLSGSLVYKLLDENDWLDEPTWLAYNTSTNTLYIANSGKWEVLELSSPSYSDNPELKIEWINKTGVSKIEIEILETNKILVSSINYWDYSFGTSNDFVKLENNKIKYYFISNYNSENSQSDCDWTNNWIIVNWSDNIIDCISSWTWKLAIFRNININDFTINNIKPELTENKNYYVKIDNKYYPYFTKWDNSIFTSHDNTLKVKQSLLNYPTWVTSDWTATEFDLSNFDPDDYEPNFIFSNPVKDFDKDFSWNLLNLKLNYYKYLNCFNTDDKIERTFLIKKSY